MQIKPLDKDFCIYKLDSIDLNVLNSNFCFYAKTDEEISLVCEADKRITDYVSRDDGWKAFRIEGILDFSLIGILAKITALLAENKIGIFAVSTYNTDYILVKEYNFERSLEVLRLNGYEIL